MLAGIIVSKEGKSYREGYRTGDLEHLPNRTLYRAENYALNHIGHR